MPLQQAFDGLANVLQQMPSIGDLLRLRRGLGGRLRVGRRTIAADQFDAGMGREPDLDSRGVAVGEKVDDFARLEVDDDGAVALPLAPGPVVDADESRGLRRSSLRSFDATKQGIGTDRHGELLRHPGTGLTAEGRADGKVGPGESRGRACISCGETMERLDEDSTRALRRGTEESTDGHPESDPVPEGRFLGEAASVAAMDSPGLLPAGGTGCIRGRGGDPEGQSGAIEISPDQATADGSTKELGEKQASLPGDEEWGQTGGGDNLSTFFDHQKCERTQAGAPGATASARFPSLELHLERQSALGDLPATL